MALTQEVSDELTKFVAQQFTALPDFTDDAREISEYIVLLIANGRSAEETFTEVQDLVSNPGLQAVVVNTFKAVEDYQNAQNQQNQQQQQQQSQQQPPQTEQPAPSTYTPSSTLDSTPTPVPSSQANGDNTDEIITDNGASRPIPSRPAAFGNRNVQRGGNAISKARGNGLNKSFALRNTDTFQKALNLSSNNGSNTFLNARGQLKKKGRCHRFPHCPHKDCVYSHPTRPCFQYPNCPNPPGTCNYLHPGEDDALVAEIEKTRREFNEQKRNTIAQHVQNSAGIALCKFGIVCTNPQCPFGHPTPANEDNKVTNLEWCPANLKCEDTSCTKAHSSLSKIREVKPVNNAQSSFPSTAPSASSSAEKSLDPCKFGNHCSNRFCKFRHATSPVLCRDGENCTRIDCYFSHPLNEVCRFGEGCKNPKCLFKHPDGKAEASSKPRSLTWVNPTNERQFAVPDHEVLETAPVQEE